jgi:hypothetical protein
MADLEVGLLPSPRVIASSCPTSFYPPRRSNLDSEPGNIVNLTIIHAGANAAISTLLPGGKGEITSSA